MDIIRVKKMESVKIRTSDRKIHGKLVAIAVYVNGKLKFRLRIRDGVDYEGNHDIAAAEAARVSSKKWGLLLKTNDCLGSKEWEMLKLDW